MVHSDSFVLKNGKVLRKGYTTGSCAAAAAAAAAAMLLSEERVQQVKLITPNTTALNLDIEKIEIQKEFVSCAVKKFSGDDPDITNGVLVYAKVSKTPSAITVVGGKGVGTVTKPGLSVEVGKPAINPVPMKMIKSEVQKVAKKYNYSGGLQIEISIPEGQKLANKTFNPRLGITGGISVLGTTGIVEPMSNQAVIDTIKAEVDIIKAAGETSIMVVPGNYGRDFAKNQFGISFAKAVQCSNFMGETLDYIRHIGFQKVLIMGHGGKLIKVAGGVMNTHSSMADCRMEILTAHAAMIHPLTQLQAKQLMGCITTDAATKRLKDIGIAQQVWNSIGEKMVFYMQNRLGEDTTLYTVVFGEEGVLYQNKDTSEIAEEFSDDR